MEEEFAGIVGVSSVLWCIMLVGPGRGRGGGACVWLVGNRGRVFLRRTHTPCMSETRREPLPYTP